MTITITGGADDCDLFELGRNDFCAQPTMHLIEDEALCLARLDQRLLVDNPHPGKGKQRVTITG